MNFSNESLLFAVVLVLAMAISSSSGAANNWSGFAGLGQPGLSMARTDSSESLGPRSLTPIVGGTCTIVCDGVYEKYQLETMKVVLPCNSACKIVDRMVEIVTDAIDEKLAVLLK